MSKGLEALKDLYKLRAEMLEEKVCHKDSKWQENIKIYDRWGDNLICIEKSLKALEIIKKNPFDILEWAKQYDEVNDTCYYELLKEVLL